MSGGDERAWRQSRERHRRNGCSLPTVCYCSEQDTPGRRLSPASLELQRAGMIYASGITHRYAPPAGSIREQVVRHVIAHHRTPSEALAAARQYAADGSEAWWSQPDWPWVTVTEVK